MSNQTFVVRKPLYNERVRLVCRRDDSITVAISDQKNKTFDTSAVKTRYNGSIILLKLQENFRGHQRNISYIVSEGQLSWLHVAWINWSTIKFANNYYTSRAILSLCKSINYEIIRHILWLQVFLTTNSNIGS